MNFLDFVFMYNAFLNIDEKHINANCTFKEDITEKLDKIINLLEEQNRVL